MVEIHDYDIINRGSLRSGWQSVNFEFAIMFRIYNNKQTFLLVQRGCLFITSFYLIGC